MRHGTAQATVNKSGLRDYSQVDKLGVWYKFVNFGVRRAEALNIGAIESTHEARHGASPTTTNHAAKDPCVSTSEMPAT